MKRINWTEARAPGALFNKLFTEADTGFTLNFMKTVVFLYFSIGTSVLSIVKLRP